MARKRPENGMNFSFGNCQARDVDDDDGDDDNDDDDAARADKNPCLK